jgi:hypothetical protein
MHAVQFMSTAPPFLHAFPFQNKQFTVYKFSPEGNISIVRWRGSPSQRTIEILPEGVGDFPVLHFLPVFDFISHFYQLFLVWIRLCDLMNVVYGFQQDT